jgi:hypothetical protein
VKMSDDDAKAAGLEAMACPVWRWMPGMTPGGSGLAHRVLGMCSDGSVTMGYLGSGECYQSDDGVPGAWPDLRDAATFGAAVAWWQLLPGHVFRVPCPVLAAAAAFGVGSHEAVRALVDAFKAADGLKDVRT